jgi:hypothetical protein
MLRSMNDLENYTIGAADGTIGHVTDFYFDDDKWVIRYFVVDTGSWLLSRKVLISPVAIANPDWTEKILTASITKEQVKNSPDIERLAMVGEKKWQHGMAIFCKPFTTAMVRYFEHADAAEARTWLDEA